MTADGSVLHAPGILPNIRISQDRHHRIKGQDLPKHLPEQQAPQRDP